MVRWGVIGLGRIADTEIAPVQAFEDAVRDGREPSPSGVEGLRSVELTTAIAQSIAERRTVPVRQAASAAW